MLSTFPAMFSSDTTLGTPFPVFQGGFTPWNFQELNSIIQPQKPVTGDYGSDYPNRNHVNSNSGSGCSDDPNLTVSISDERKMRRMISNRESARRSRMRKQKHLENLRNQANRLRTQNRILKDRLRNLLCCSEVEQKYNDQLQSEYSRLQERLAGIRQVLFLRELQHFSSPWPCNTPNIMSVNEQTTSLITQF